MRKITMQKFMEIIEKGEIYIPLPLMPIFDENEEAWVMEGTIEEYRSARNYFGALAECL